MLAALAALAICAHTVLSSGEFFLYLYGATWCPHCRVLSDFFNKSFPGNSYFCKIDEDRSCKEALSSLNSYLESKGVPKNVTGYIPLTLVVVEGRYVAAIVIGAVTDTAFWRDLSRVAPREGIPIMLGRDRVYEVQLTYEEQAQLVSNYIRLPEATPTRSGLNQLEPQVLVALALVVAGVAVVAYSLVRRR